MDTLIRVTETFKSLRVSKQNDTRGFCNFLIENTTPFLGNEIIWFTITYRVLRLSTYLKTSRLESSNLSEFVNKFVLCGYNKT